MSTGSDPAPLDTPSAQVVWEAKVMGLDVRAEFVWETGMTRYVVAPEDVRPPSGPPTEGDFSHAGGGVGHPTSSSSFTEEHVAGC